MTLNTVIYLDDVYGRHVAEEVYEFFNVLLGPRPDGLPTERHPEKMAWSEEGVFSLGNRLGQGLPAILEVQFREGAPLATVEQAAAHNEDCEWDQKEGNDCSWNHPVATGIKISLDTTYGYSDEYGSCTMLHARYLVAFYEQVVKPRGLKMRWVNEFNGEINEGLNGLEEFFGDGDKADDWFKGILMPFLNKNGFQL